MKRKEILKRINKWHKDVETKLKVWEYIGMSKRDYIYWLETGNIRNEKIKKEN